MIVPTISDVIHGIAQAVDEVIAPQLTGLRERSAITTIRHLLRFVENRVEGEGQLWFDESRKLEALLASVAERFERQDELKAIAAAIRATLAIERDAAVYPSITILSQEVGRLRGHVNDALVALRALPVVARGADTEAVHGELREYITWQLDREAKIVEPSFFGHGARR